MTYKCRICGTNEVEHPGDVCDLCAIGQDPYAAAMQENIATNNNFSQSTYDNGGSTVTTEPAYTTVKGKSRKVLLGGGASISNVDPSTQ